MSRYKMRYIDADKLIEEIQRCSYETWSKDVNRAWWAQAVKVKDNIVHCIEKQPTADVVEVRHGYWLSAYEYALKLGETDPYRLSLAEHDKIWHFCSLCEQQVRFKRPYCPECGAKMDGERRADDGRT